MFEFLRKEVKATRENDMEVINKFDNVNEVLMCFVEGAVQRNCPDEYKSLARSVIGGYDTLMTDVLNLSRHQISNQYNTLEKLDKLENVNKELLEKVAELSEKLDKLQKNKKEN